MSKAILCTFCKNPYDLEVRLPHVAPCGHSVCRECLKELKLKKFAQCEECGTGFSVYAFPTNHCLKSQLEYTPNVSSDGSKEKLFYKEPEQNWSCSECGLGLHPRHARVCIKCTTSDVVENLIDGLKIHNYEKAESHLVCPHCVMESKHRFHITKLYLPTKIKQVTEERFEELFERLRKQHCGHEEIAIVVDALLILRDKCSSSMTWAEFEEEWYEAEHLANGIIQMNSNISSALHDVERALRQIEQCQQKKQRLMNQMTYAISRNDSDNVKRRLSNYSLSDKVGQDLASRVASIKRNSGIDDMSTEESDSDYQDSDSDKSFSSKLKKFATVMDLSKAEW